MDHNHNQDPSFGVEPTPEETRQQRLYLLIGAVALLLLLAGSIAAALFLVSNPARAETIRDVVIIFMALEFLVIGLALVILIVQLARLTALLQNEVGPILRSTHQTVNTLRGTTAFLSENLVSPVVKVSSSVAAVQRALNLIRPGRSD